MAEELTTQLVATFDGSQASSGLAKLGTDAEKVSRKVKEAGDSANGGLKRIKDGAGVAADGFDVLERKAARSIQLMTNKMAAAGDAVKEWEGKLALKGLDQAKFKPYLDDMQRVVERSKAATLGMDNMGMSAKQTAAALRGVPAQFTDIIVSLQGGMNPMTVFLQQGGQLKDMFGGAGAAAKALSGYIAGLVNPYTVVAAAIAGVGIAYHQGSREQDSFVKAIALSGNASGVSAGQLREYAREIDSVIGTQAQAAEGLSAFAAAGVRGGNQLRQYTQTAIEWEKVTGQAVSKTAEQFASLQDDPLKAVLKLNEGTNFLTASVYEQIKALSDQGRNADAARVAMDALDTSMRDRAETIKQSLGYLERGWKAITGAAKDAWDAMLNVGRAATINDKLGDVRAELNQLLSQQGWGETGGGAATGRYTSAERKRIEERIAALRAEEWQLEANAAAERINAAAQEESSRITQAKIKWSQEGERYLSRQAQMERELAKARVEAADAGITGAALDERLTAIREKYAEKTRGATSSTRDSNIEFERQRSLMAQLAGLSSDFYKQWDELTKIFKSGGMSVKELEQQQQKLLAKQPAMVQAAKDEADALKEKIKQYQADLQAQEAILKARQKAAETMGKSVQDMRDEISALRMASTENVSMAKAVAKVALARAQENRDKAIAKGIDADNLKALDDEIAKRRELIELIGSKDAFAQAQQAQREMVAEFERSVQQVEDIFVRGFADMMNNGKSGWDSFCKSLKTSFYTLVAREIYAAFAKPFVVQIVGSLLGISGGNGAGAAVQAGSSLLSGANDASSLYNIGGAIWQGFSGAAVGASTASLVGANLWGAVGGDALGAMIAMNGGWAGVSVGAGAGAAAGGAAAGAGAAGAAGTGSLAAGLSAIPVWGWIAAAVVAAIGWIVGNDDSGTPHSGSVGSYNRETGYRQVQNGMELGDASIDMGMIYGGEELAKIPQTISKGVVDVLDNLDMAFGGKGGYTVTTGFADDSSKDGAWGGLRIIGKDGKDLVNWDEGKGKWAPRVFSNGEDGLNEYLDAVALDTRKVMMESMDLPTWAKEIVGGIKEEDFNLDALQAVVTQIGQVQAVFDGLAETLVGFANISSDAMGKMAAASGGVDKLTANASTYYENFYSEAERTDKQREMINKSLSGLGLDKLDLSASDAREQFRKLIEEQLALGDSSAETVAALLALSGAVAQVTTTAEDAARAEKERAEAQAQEAERAAKAAIDFAMRSLEFATNRDINALNAQKSALAQQRTLHNESLSLITSIFQLVKSNAEDLYGDVESVVQMQATQGRAFITDALFAARKTGYLPEHDKLSEAISAARAGINEGAYATQFERDADVLKLAGQLSALEEISAKQKTFEELQLEALDNQILAIDKQTKLLQDQLALAKEALAIAQGEYDATISTNEALAKFYALVDAHFNPAAVDGQASGATGGPVIGGGVAGKPVTSGPTGSGGYYREVKTGTGTSYVVDNSQHLKDVDTWLDQYRGTGDVEGMLNSAKGDDISMNDIAAVMGWDYEDLIKAGERLGIPKFDVGTNYVPRTTMAIVHEGERIIPKADNSALMAALNGGGSGGGNAALVVEVRALREEVAALRASADRTASNTDKLPQMADQFDNVTEGGNAARVEVMA